MVKEIDNTDEYAFLIPSLDYDYVVIGAGPGGYVSAIRASQLGLKTAVVEAAEVGGVCLNWGCIPTKSLLESAHFFSKLQNQTLGILLTQPASFDMKAIVKRSREIAGKLSTGIEHLFKKYKVTLLKGRGVLNSENEVHIFDREGVLSQKITAKNICLATGAHAREFPNLKFSSNVISYREAMLLDVLPQNILIIGAGAIGCEFADFFACLGSKVSLVELAEHILPLEEEFLAKELKKAFKQKGIEVFEKTSVDSLNDKGEFIEAVFSAKGQSNSQPETQKFEKVLLAVGIEINIDGLGLENTPAKLDNGRIKVDEFCQIQDSKTLFAIGDITQGKQLAHKASHEGIMVAEKLAGKQIHPLDHSNIPSCVYTSPQVASVGLSSKELNAQNIPFEEGSFPLMASGKALAIGDGSGLLKSYVHKETRELLGAHYIGPDVTELISNFTLARNSELTSDEFLESVFPHPTLSEAVHESIGQALKVSVNF